MRIGASQYSENLVGLRQVVQCSTPRTMHVYEKGIILGRQLPDPVVARGSRPGHAQRGPPGNRRVPDGRPPGGLHVGWQGCPLVII
jgi:hypothetical protein